MKIEKLFNYRPDGKEITLNDGETKEKVMVIRRGPRGIVAMVRGRGPIMIWDNDNVDAHVGDDEATLIQKTIDVLNA
jgi:hypothetical protein